MGEKVPQVLDWLGFNLNPDFGRSRLLGKLLGIAIIVVILALGSLVLTETFAALLGLGLEAGTTQHEAIRNTGLALAAMVGVPFLVWRSVVAQKQVDVTEQGHITDRINKAVEGLGAEKKVDQIGRPVTIYSGDKRTYKAYNTELHDFKLLPRSVSDEPEWFKGRVQEVEDWEGWQRNFTTWSKEETRIEWEDASLALAPEEHLANKGDWQVFSRSEPNLEVRIGAILSLERIAQDSARDHIQIMEILCAYIRENIGNRRIPPPPEDPTPEDWSAWGNKGHEAARLDIDMALKVIERRGAVRKAAESAQEPPFRLGLERLVGARLGIGGRDLDRADLSRADLRGSDLWGANLRAANLGHARLQGAVLGFAHLQDANLGGANLQGANLVGAELQGARLMLSQLHAAHLAGARFQWANFTGAKLQDANMAYAKLQRSNLSDANLQCVDLGRAKLQGANLIGASMQGADLEHAELQGAIIARTAFDEATVFNCANLRGALLRSVDFSTVDQIADHLDPSNVFFDGSITLPGGITSDMSEWLYEGRREILEFNPRDPESSPLFLAWRAWQREHHPDTLPDHLR